MGQRVEAYTVLLNDDTTYTVCGNDLLSVDVDSLKDITQGRTLEQDSVCNFCGHALV
jgi:hypothetical protein